MYPHLDSLDLRWLYDRCLRRLDDPLDLHRLIVRQLDNGHTRGLFWHRHLPTPIKTMMTKSTDGKLTLEHRTLMFYITSPWASMCWRDTDAQLCLLCQFKSLNMSQEVLCVCVCVCEPEQGLQEIDWHHCGSPLHLSLSLSNCCPSEMILMYPWSLTWTDRLTNRLLIILLRLYFLQSPPKQDIASDCYGKVFPDLITCRSFFIPAINLFSKLQKYLFTSVLMESSVATCRFKCGTRV